MRFLLVLGICFCFANSIALGQRADSSRSLAPASQRQATPQSAPRQTTPPPQTTPPQTTPSRTTPPQTTPSQTTPPQTTPPQTTPPADDLNLDSNQSYNFNDLDSSQYASTSDPQSSIASNSDFRGASPQMIGDFGGGSTILKLHNNLFTFFGASPLTVQIPFAGGSRRIKAAENNQVQPLNRVYGTFNYFDNALVSGGPAGPVNSEGLYQYTMGIEKKFFEYFSIDVRMPLIGAINHTAVVFGPLPGDRTSANVSTSGIGNLSTSIKALLLQMGRTSISGGLQLSIPTGSDARIIAGRTVLPNTENLEIVVDNDALHLMPFIGAYRSLGDYWWLQAFTQVDVPTRGNDVRLDGVFFGRINEQTLLYADVSLGTWLYRNQGRQGRQRGVTGIASVFELHYTGSLNNVDTLFTPDPPQNLFNALNLTAGLQVELSEEWRINVSGVVPLLEREFDGSQPDFPKRREDRFFDGELSLQINRFF